MLIKACENPTKNLLTNKNQMDFASVKLNIRIPLRKKLIAVMYFLLILLMKNDRNIAPTAVPMYTNEPNVPTNVFLICKSFSISSIAAGIVP